jgi:hypothetical protein
VGGLAWVLVVTFTPEELALLKAALTIPTCWDPERRKLALVLVERADEQLALFAEAAS